MLGRALGLATAMLMIGFAAASCFSPVSFIATAEAQNLEAGKSPAQLFSSNCSICHKSARGLLKSVAPGQLPGFLRQHYTTSTDMAATMSAYVIANGAGGSRRPNDDNLTRQGRELSREQQPAPADAVPPGRPRPAAPERQQAQPGPDGVPAAEPAPRRGRNAKRPPRVEQAAPDAEPRPGEPPAAAEVEPPVQKQKKGTKGRRHQGAPKPDAVTDEPKHGARPETDKSEPAKSEPAKSEPAKSEPAREAAPSKPADDSKPAEAAKPEAKPETPPATRVDPVPAVTPAPKEPEPSTSTPASPPAAATPAPPPAAPNPQ